MRKISRRRVLTVTLTAVVSLAVLAGYTAGDIADLVPGYLTARPAQASTETLSTPQTALTSSRIIGESDLTARVDQAEVTDAITALTSDQSVGTELSVIVSDATGEDYSSLNPGAAREPASTLKTLTALAAVETLDMADTLDTSVLLASHTDTSATLVLTGEGDMMLTAGGSDPDHVNGRAGLQTLTNETVTALREKGISEVTLTYDDSLFGAQRTPATMDSDMSETGYFTPVASMAIDQGRVTPAEPTSDPDAEPTSYPARSTTPASDTAAMFSKQLAAAGIAVNGDPKATTSSAQDSETLGTVTSAPLWQLLRFTLQLSDNTYAELFGRLVALTTGAENSPLGATQAITKVLTEHGIDTTGLQLRDSSGLADGSFLTARTLIDVQQKYLTTASADLLESLAVSGLSGTAEKRTFSDEANGLVRLKTGTLPTTTSMTGTLVTASGAVLTFAVIVNNPQNMWSAQRAVDTFVSSLAAL